MRKIILIIALFALSSLTVFSKDKIAMLDFSGAGLSRGDAESLIGLFTSEFTRSQYRRDLTILARSEVALQKAFGELNFQRTSMLNESQIGKVGQQLGADYVFYGTVATFGKNVTITASVLDVETAEVIASVTSRLSSIYDVDAEEVTRELVSEIKGSYFVSAKGGVSSESSLVVLNNVLDMHEGEAGVANIRAIVRSGNLNGRGTGGYTALMFAARNGHFGIVEALINAGANVNVKAGKITALSLAIKYNEFEVAQLLKAAGAKN